MANERSTNKRSAKEPATKTRSTKDRPSNENSVSSRSSTESLRSVTASSSIDSLKKEAKRWLKGVRANDKEARARFRSANPDAPSAPTLRDVQHALAREHGFAGWAELKKQLEDRGVTNKPEGQGNQSLMSSSEGRPITIEQREELVNRFLEYACIDPILCNGPAGHARRERAALRILMRHPWIAHANIQTAVVCGEIEEVERILKERSEAAIEQSGPQRRRHLPAGEKLWTPLLHLCYGRLPTAAAGDNAVAIARRLLDHGADPNDYFECGSHPCRYTALCGIAGEGEDDGPPHPQKHALARLLLERGAEPYDLQLLYNTHFHGDVQWILELIHEFAVKAGRQADWDDPNWSMLDNGGFGSGARYLLGFAVTKNKLELAEWLLKHGASPNAPPSSHPRTSKRSLHEEAQRLGFTEMSSLLVQFGAEPSHWKLHGIEAFIEACFRLDRQEASKHLAEHPEYLQSTLPIFVAARRDRADVVDLLLDLGTPIEIEDEKKTRPLHEAASHDSIRVAELLINRGAEIEPVELNWNNTPLDFALYQDLPRMTGFLSGFTKDVFRLAWIGNIDRLREVLSEDESLARVVDAGNTPLMWLPDDDARAKEVVELLTQYGADVALRNTEGMTAAELAERRGLYEAAELLRSKGRPNS